MYNAKVSSPCDNAEAVYITVNGKGDILTAMITTVRSAKAVITTFCRMFSCGDGGREVSLSKHAFIFTGIQSLCKNKRCFR